MKLAQFNNQQVMASKRRDLVQWVKSQLTGGYLKTEVEINFSPLERYVSGVLFPIDRHGAGLDPAGDLDNQSDDIESASEAEHNEVAPVKRRRYVPPSSVGFSFYVAEDDWQIQLIASAKRFILVDDRDESGRYTESLYHKYKVEGLFLPNESIVVTKTGEYLIFDNDSQALAKIDVRSTSHGEGTIVTVTLINNQELGVIAADEKQAGKQNREEQIKTTLFDVQFCCVIDRGVVGDYPSVDYALLSDSEQEMELQYSHKKVYAVGHGAAVYWELDKHGRVHKIMSDFVPIQEVPQVTADLSDVSLKTVLSMEFLSQADTKTSLVCEELSKFIGLYKDWIVGQSDALDEIEPKHRFAGERLVERMRITFLRMQSGIERIKNDKQVAKAFAYANHAMFLQMKHPSKSWRAFQLAFILTALVSTTDENDEFRDTVDLIWFPTGGGKTEAYLGLTAYQILYRRLRYPQSGGGTTVLMRYTLKLLTTQQFLRACRLICALELIRQNHHEFGNEPITIGLWVGESASPNTLAKAIELFNKAKNKGDFSHFVLEKCPWCDTSFSQHNFKIDTGRFYFVCKNTRCAYNDRSLPCQVVDEMLYKSPPTLLLATLDKLAMLAWEERSGAFFGINDNCKRPPELIIQDELHLIANALGSVAGIYESAIQTVLTSRNIKPKYVASTATIKEAQDQVQKLFAKKLAIFPPQGLSTDDAFFAKTVDLSVRAGRLYVGYFAPLLNRQKNLAPLAGLLLIAPFVLFGRNQDDYETWLDAWWTQLVYHGSLKGVGNSHTSFDSTIRKRYNDYVKEFFEYGDTKNVDIKQLYQAYEYFLRTQYDESNRLSAFQKFLTESHFNHNHIQKFNHIYQQLEQSGFDVDFYWQVLSKQIDKRERPTIKQLTSNSTASENAHIFSQLDLTCNNQEAIDVVLATNMVATGLDVARLALMIINGQPLTTAEYIQASSRVGRSDVAGVVFINYYRDQARSLSHYENFYPYHQSFYRYVEPTSVTPYTHQARRRALHAALVISLRYGVPYMLTNDGAAKLGLDDKDIQRTIDIFKDYCSRADSERASATCHHIDELLNEWQEYLKTQKQTFRQKVYYHNKNKGNTSLLYHHNSNENGLWATLTNMRNVENSGILRIV